jgi:hypothetical protein
LDLREKTFREMAKAYPQVAPLHELRHTLAKLRQIELRVGADGRNRTVLWPCRSKTSRTQPSASKFLFGPSCWLRSLMRPEPGQSLAYVDWSAMEFGIAAALSRDPRMMAAYSDGQPYIDFAISFGAAPPGATKKTHPDVHELYKVVCLGAQYGMQPVTLAQRLESVRSLYQGLHSFRNMRRMEASLRKARALRLRFSQSLASRRQRINQAMVRSTIQRFGNGTNPLARSERLTISVLRLGRTLLSAVSKIGPA